MLISYYKSNQTFIKDCKYPALVGDGYCNDETNIAACNYDGGDCCYNSCIVTNKCTNCSCIGDILDEEIKNPLIGNGECNGAIDIEECNYDDDDCAVLDQFDWLAALLG